MVFTRSTCKTAEVEGQALLGSSETIEAVSPKPDINEVAKRKQSDQMDYVEAEGNPPPRKKQRSNRKKAGTKKALPNASIEVSELLGRLNSNHREEQKLIKKVLKNAMKEAKEEAKGEAKEESKEFWRVAVDDQKTIVKGQRNEIKGLKKELLDSRAAYETRQQETNLLMERLVDENNNISRTDTKYFSNEWAALKSEFADWTSDICMSNACREPQPRVSPDCNESQDRENAKTRHSSSKDPIFFCDVAIGQHVFEIFTLTGSSNGALNSIRDMRVSLGLDAECGLAAAPGSNEAARGDFKSFLRWRLQTVSFLTTTSSDILESWRESVAENAGNAYRQIKRSLGYEHEENRREGLEQLFLKASNLILELWKESKCHFFLVWQSSVEGMEYDPRSMQLDTDDKSTNPRGLEPVAGFRFPGISWIDDETGSIKILAAPVMKLKTHPGYSGLKSSYGEQVKPELIDLTRPYDRLQDFGNGTHPPESAHESEHPGDYSNK